MTYYSTDPAEIQRLLTRRIRQANSPQTFFAFEIGRHHFSFIDGVIKTALSETNGRVPERDLRIRNAEDFHYIVGVDCDSDHAEEIAAYVRRRMDGLNVHYMQSTFVECKPPFKDPVTEAEACYRLLRESAEELRR